MKKLIAFCISGFGLVLTNSCKNELDALATYEESVAVYSLIDTQDSVNYIRVNRVFLGKGDANEIAQVRDSVYFKPGEAAVYIEKYWNGTKKQTYMFSESYEKPLSSGVFNSNQLIYKSIQKFKSDSAGKYFEYKLVVKNTTSGKEFTSKNVKMIKDVLATSPQSTLCTGALGANCFFTQSNVGILANATAKTKVMFMAPAQALMAGFRTNFYYHAVYNDNSTANRSVTIDMGTQKLDAGQTVDYTFGGYQYYTTLSNVIPAETNLLERVPDSIGFVFTLAGEEYCFYQEINNTSGTFGQEKPIYTNMNDGAIGLFSSRTKVTVTKKFWDFAGGPGQTNVITNQSTQDLIKSPITCHLLFRALGWTNSIGC